MSQTPETDRLFSQSSHQGIYSAFFLMRDHAKRMEGQSYQIGAERDAARRYKFEAESERDKLRDAIRLIAVTSHSTIDAVRLNAIEDAERLLPENQTPKP